MATKLEPPAYRLAMIDGQPDFLTFAEGELHHSASFEVVGTETDGMKALDLVTLTRPDVVLIDIFMPGSNGFDIARRLRPVFPDLGVVFLSIDNIMQYPLIKAQLGDLTCLSKKWLSETYLLAILTDYRNRGWTPSSWTS